MIRHLLNAVVFFTMAIIIMIQQNPTDGLLIQGYMLLAYTCLACVIMGAFNLAFFLEEYLK